MILHRLQTWVAHAFTYSKYILRESTKNILNDQVRLDRNKKGYNASIDSFLNLKDKTTIEYLMENSPIFEIVNRKNFEDYLLGTNFYNNHNKKYLFSFLNCKMFLELNEWFSVIVAYYQIQDLI